MAKRTMDEKDVGIFFNGLTSYIPLPKEWRTMLERNNIGIEYDENMHYLKLRLLQNKAGQLFIEAWLEVKKPQERGVEECQK